MKDVVGQSNIVGTNENQSIDFKGNIYRLKNYLKEFHELHKGKSVDVEHCDDLLVSAALINMQNEAWEQFSKVHRHINEQSISEEHTSELQSRFELVCRLL